VESAENQTAVFLSFHRPWKSLCDFHIPTASTTQWKSGKPKTGFPLFHCTIPPSRSNQKGGPAADRFAPAFRLILGLENAALALEPGCGGAVRSEFGTFYVR
jgi:hypothetical protein